MIVRRVILAIALLGVLSACGQPDAPGTGAVNTTPVPVVPTALSQRLLTSTQIAAGQVIIGEHVTLRSLRARVATAPIIVIGQVKDMGEVINMARDVDDPTKPATNRFGIGQVYHFQVQQVLKGTVPEVLNVVQSEGAISGNPATVTADAIARAKGAHGYGDSPLTSATTYLLFLDPLEYFDPATQYVTGGISPWKFVLATDGTFTIEGPGGNDPDFLPNPDAPLVPQVVQIIKEQASTP